MVCDDIHVTARHISREHEHCVDFSVKCVYCLKTFVHVKKWKRHVVEVHGYVNVAPHPTAQPGPSTTTHRSVLSTSTSVCPDDVSLRESEIVTPATSYVGSYDLEHPAQFLLQLKSSGLTDTHCNKLVDYFRKYAHNVASECINSVASGVNPDPSSLPSVKALHEVHSSSVQDKYASRNLLCVKPCAVPLGKSENGKPLTFQYIPLTEQLQSLFLSKRFEDCNIFGARPSQKPGVYRDIFDGTCHPSVENRISLILFFDDFVVSCPIGSHTKQYKLGAVYCCIANLNEDRAHVGNTLLLLLFHSKLLEKFSWNVILKPLLDELVTLEECGTLIVHRGNRISVSVRVEFVCGDNLGIHSIAGFFAAFSNTNRLCRCCYTSPVELKSCFNANEFRPRTQELYERELGILAANDFSKVYCKRFGIKFPCPFRVLKQFHVADFFPFDIVHDLFEGIVKYVINLVLTAGLQKSLVNLNALNGVIATFPFSPLEGNKPVPLQRSNNAVCVGGTASELWTLLRFLPLLLSEVESGLLDAPEFQVLQCLICIVQYAVSPVLCEADLVELEQLVGEWLNLLKSTFTEFTPTPKFHYLLHYVDQIRKHGPLRRCWTMRFEGKHQNLKSFLARSKNTKNVCKTIATRHQRFIASAHNTTRPDAVSSQRPLCRKDKPSLPPGVELLLPEGCKLLKTVTYMCTKYAADQVVTVKYGDDVALCQIVCICMKDSVMQFVVRYLDATDLPRLSCVEVHDRDQFGCVRQNCLADYLPLACYLLREKKLVVQKHKRPSAEACSPSNEC